MKILSLLFVFTISFAVMSQEKAILFFNSKPDVSTIDINDCVSNRSLKRRLSKDVVINSLDVPVNPSYLNELAQYGVVLKKSKWLNAVIYSSVLSEEELKSKFEFIERVQFFKKHSISEINKSVLSEEKAIDYGAAQGQTEQINVNCLHDQAYTGDGVYLAVIDAGFTNMDNVSYFDSLFIQGRVLDKYNFTDGNTDVYGNSDHGTMVTSCIVGEKHSGEKYVGTAIDVDIALYRSEEASTETISEEFDLVLALERCDSVGVDIANISLGYVDFDDPSSDHVYADMDGTTTIAAMGVNAAATKGIAVIIAAGNGGPQTISTPCDADNGFCIGAVDALNEYAFFSSVGPSSDGQVKPDVVARGEGAWIVNPNDMTESGNGTSFASPIICGATACLIQANPSSSVQEIFNAIRQSADQYATPDGFKGYGLPDFCVADQILKAASLKSMVSSEMILFPNPVSDFLTIESEIKTGSIQVYNSVGKKVLLIDAWNQTMIDVSNLSSGIYTIELLDNTSVAVRSKFIKK